MYILLSCDTAHNPLGKAGGWHSNRCLGQGSWLSKLVGRAPTSPMGSYRIVHWGSRKGRELVTILISSEAYLRRISILYQADERTKVLFAVRSVLIGLFPPGGTRR